MCAMQNFTQNQQQNQQQNPQPPVQPQPEYKFRWVIFLGIPLTIAIFIYVIKNIEPSFHFGDILDKLDVIYRTKYTRLACLAVLCLALLIIAKLFRNNQD